MNSVHFKVLSLSINGVFGPSVEMELESSISIRGLKMVSGESGSECLGGLPNLVDGGLGGVTIPCDGDFVGSIGVSGLVGVHLVSSVKMAVDFFCVGV